MTCTTPIYGDRIRHDCCVIWDASCADCPACKESRRAERAWLRDSRICDDCGLRSKFRTPVCPSCERKREELAEA